MENVPVETGLTETLILGCDEWKDRHRVCVMISIDFPSRKRRFKCNLPFFISIHSKPAGRYAHIWGVGGNPAALVPKVCLARVTDYEG